MAIISSGHELSLLRAGKREEEREGERGEEGRRRGEEKRGGEGGRRRGEEKGGRRKGEEKRGGRGRFTYILLSTGMWRSHDDSLSTSSF